MWLCLFAIVLILTITFIQSLQGMFTAIITCLLTILSAALAFGLYETIYYQFLISSQPEHGRAFALAGIFIISLILLRGIFDAIITGNMQFHPYVDRAGGAVFGLISAIVTVGTITTALQMYPFGFSVFGFSRYSLVDPSGKVQEPAYTPKEGEDRTWLSKIDWSKIEHRRNNIWLSPDAITVALMGHLSANGLHGATTLTDVYPDLLNQLHAVRSNHYRESINVALARDAVKIVLFADMPPKSFYDREIKNVQGSPKSLQVELKLYKDSPAPGHKWVVVRAKIDSGSQDEDGTYRFTTEQVRLLGRERPGGPVREYRLIGVSHDQFARWCRLYRGEEVCRKVGNLEIDWIFEIPSDSDFVPMFVEYKQNAWAELPPLSAEDKKKPKAVLTPLAPAGKPGEKGKEGRPKTTEGSSGEQQPTNPPEPPQSSAPPQNQPPRQQDRISGLGPAKEKETFFTKQFPIPLTEYSSQDLQLGGGGELLGGRIQAQLNKDWTPKQGNDRIIESFQVPEGQVMLQLSVEKLQPGSWIGKIYGGIIDKVSNFYLIDASNRNYPPVGTYAIATVGGEVRFELIYLDETQRVAGHLPKFEKIKSDHLKGNYALYYLFHLPPGTKPVKLNTGRQVVQLEHLNLVAPPSE